MLIQDFFLCLGEYYIVAGDAEEGRYHAKLTMVVDVGRVTFCIVPY